MNDKELADAITKAMVAARGQTILTGGPERLVEPMQRLGYFPSYADDVPGFGDDIAGALETPEGIAYGKNANERPRYKRWDEYFYDLSVASAIGDYGNFFVRFINEASAAKPKAITAAENIIEKLDQKYKIDIDKTFGAIAAKNNEKEAALYRKLCDYIGVNPAIV
ncbi:MAG: hypothetical protein KJ697_04160 [Nanoarchaeota archaeon]|nr:hypothetical protein [Nanoarchaeota archaeon]